MSQTTKTILRIFALSIGIKLLIPFIGLALAEFGLLHPPGHKLLFSDLSFQNYLQSYFNSDSGWYRVIALFGYENIPTSEMHGWKSLFLHFAFFPLFPFLISGLSTLTGMEFFLSVFFLNILILLALAGIWVKYLFHRGLDQKQVTRLSVILFCSPLSLHLYFIYTESLYLLLLLSVFYAAEKGKWIQTAIFASLMVLTRPNGIMVLIPLLFIIIDHYRQQTAANTFIKIKLKPLPILALVLAPFTLIIWMYYQYTISGDPFLFSHAQSAWNKNLMFPLLALFRHGFWDQQLTSVLIIIAIIAAIVAGRKWNHSYRALVWTGILLPLTAGSVISMTRYLSVLFPYYISLSGFIKKKYYLLLLIVCIVLQFLAIKWWFEDSAMMY